MTNFDTLYAAADSAGKAAVNSAVVVPMTVGFPSTPFGNDIDYAQPTYFVEDGVCGFAWINVRPGNSAFAKYLKTNGLGRKDDYYKGVTISVRDYNQSMQRKEAYAEAFAEVLNKSGINALAMSRMD